MNTSKSDEILPKSYAIFIIAALLPQILGINGGMLDMVWKLVVIGSLLFLTRKNFLSFYLYSFIYILLSSTSQICAVAFNNESILSVLVNLVITTLVVIVFFNYPLQVKKIKIDEILIFYKIFVYFMLISCIYNVVLHPSRIFTLTSFDIYGSEEICSFFDNKNTFGVFLLFASLATVILKYYTKQNRWSYILGLIIINEIMAGCRTAIIISIVLMIASILITKNGITFKRIIITALVVAVFAFLLNYIEIFNRIFNNLFSSTESMDTRNDYIDSMKPLITGIYAVFGYGNATSAELAYKYTGNQYYHNTYLNIIITEGIIGLILFASIIFMSIKTAIKIKKYDRGASFLCVLSCFVYLVYAYVESTLLFSTPVVSMLSTIFVVSMPILFLKAVKSQEYNEMDCMT